ncbi:MAG: KGG domain-containing protein [Armatimonadota bacterium]
MPREKSEEKKDMTVAEAGKKGGETVKEKYGKDFYTEIGHKGGAATRKKYGPEFYGEIGKKGGQSTAERHGAEFYEKIGKKGGNRVRELIQRGKQAADEAGEGEDTAKG